MGDSQGATSYEVIGKLADGDVAELFLAKAAGASGDGTMERLVVIKRIPRKATQNTELVKAFLDEAHISARLQHPNIAQVFEVGKLGGSYFFAMEYVNGETLRALVEHAKSKKIQVPIRSIVTIAAGAVAALHHAHDRTGLDGAPLGIVHADVSPTNLLVTAAIEHLAAALLGRPVRDLVRVRGDVGAVARLRDAEIDELDDALARDQEVGR